MPLSPACSSAGTPRKNLGIQLGRCDQIGGGRGDIALSRTGSLRARSVAGDDISIMAYRRQLGLLYRAYIGGRGLVSVRLVRDMNRPRVEDVPDTWTTLGMNFFPSMVVMRVTLAHAILCGSLATRIIHRFVRGEKYLTGTTTHSTMSQYLVALGERDERRTGQRRPDCAPASVPEVRDDALLERGPYLFAVDIFLSSCRLTRDGCWDRKKLDKQPTILLRWYTSELFAWILLKMKMN